MPFSKLLSGQIVSFQLLLQLPGIDEGGAIALRIRIVSTYIACCYELDCRKTGGSNRHCVGVPRIPLHHKDLRYIIRVISYVMIEFD